MPSSQPLITVLGRTVDIVDEQAAMYGVGYRVTGPRATYDLVRVGKDVFSPRNSRGNYCAIAGNYLFWRTADGGMTCGTMTQHTVCRVEEAREAAKRTGACEPAR